MRACADVLTTDLESIVKWLLLVSALLAAGTAPEAVAFSVRHADFQVRDGVVSMDADLDLQLTEATREALGNGVPITVVIVTEIVERRAYLWDQQVARIESRYALEFHPLTSQYILRNVDLGISQSFTRLGALVDGLSRIRNFPLLDLSRLRDHTRYVARVQVRLDVESLPAPLRPLAYLSSVWRITSDWYERELKL